jgi:hypothetical protein
MNRKDQSRALTRDSRDVDENKKSNGRQLFKAQIDCSRQDFSSIVLLNSGRTML